MSVRNQSRRMHGARVLSIGSDPGSCLGEFEHYLAERGYAARTIALYMNGIEPFARWLSRCEADMSDLDEAMIARFLGVHRFDSRCGLNCGRAALRHLLGMLRASGRCIAQPAQAYSAITNELAALDQHLCDVRGLSPLTRSTRRRHVKAFLDDRFPGCTAVHLSAVAPADVAQFVARYTAGWAPGSIKAAGISLRSYFAFRAVQGDSTTALAAALPHVAHWRLAGLPQVLSTEEIGRLLNAFDRRRASGKRDYAITRCLLDLGLRRAEVAQLRLEDVDWHAGTVRIHAKGKRLDVLPLPAATGRAITAYLQDGRPQTSRREIFVRHRPPLDAPADLDIVRNAVRNAAARCGLADRIRGTHILRHTLAARLVQRGTRFKDIADLLRHRSIDTTTIYAKVDLPALARVALPWPGRSV